MKIGRAEIGIILTLFSSAPFVGLWFYAIFSIFPFVGQQILMEGFFSAITIIGILLVISDPGGFLCRRKGNWQLSAVLMILGFILLISSLFVIIMEEWYWSYDVIGKFRTPSPEKLTLHNLSISWGTLAFFSSLLWLAYGFMISFIKTDFQPQKKIDFEEPWTKPPEKLLAKYVKLYPHNPEGVLEWHIHKKMKEGKTREQAIRELENIGD